ncbi:hypothetical protein OS493_040115 [Desmophyllum pertusum]|uniref:Uncharacterized protein n=1 Tax=Desmophyllum pertusum TaxID=174260 RepID=A0A9X0CTL2_9CNID|nr:hypothetical protein OS493_040115 [Desmophyllum pertusum]
MLSWLDLATIDNSKRPRVEGVQGYNQFRLIIAYRTDDNTRLQANNLTNDTVNMPRKTQPSFDIYCNRLRMLIY